MVVEVLLAIVDMPHHLDRFLETSVGRIETNRKIITCS